MPLPTDGGIVNNRANSSTPSTISSLITGTLTLLIIIILPNVAVSVVVLKSTPPVSQTLFSQHIIIHTMLPSADTGDCSDGVTVTSNGLAELPPTNSRFTTTTPEFSVPLNLACENWTSTTINNHKCDIHTYVRIYKFNTVIEYLTGNP